MTQRELQQILLQHKLWLRSNGIYGKQANLSGVNLMNMDLSDVDLSKANLRGAPLIGADLTNTNLEEADLSNANLRNANLFNTNLRNANLFGADLSDVNGLPSAIDFLKAHFERTDKGYIAYKTFNGSYQPSERWEIEPGSVIGENVDFDRCRGCGAGINVAPLDWVKKNYNGTIWKVLIRWEWLAGVCVPYHSNGKIRCERIELIETVN